MNRTTVLLSLLTAVGGSVLVATACAPQDDKAPVSIVRKTVASKAMDECLSKVRGREANVSKRFVSVCEAPKAVSPAGAYSVQSREVRYQVGHKNDKLVITLNVGLIYPENQPREIRTGVHRVLNDLCLPKIKRLWTRENVELNLQIDVAKEDVYFDQDLEIVAHPDQKSVMYPRWVASGWPDQGDLYPVGRPQDKEECKTLVDNETGDKEAEQKCLWDRYEAVNQHFCVSLALKVGEWLGLEDPRTKSCGNIAAESKTEGDVENKSIAKSATFLQPGAMSSFMKTAEDPEASGSKFWEKARISGVDLKTVLGPACPGFKSLKENPAR